MPNIWQLALVAGWEKWAEPQADMSNAFSPDFASPALFRLFGQIPFNQMEGLSKTVVSDTADTVCRFDNPFTHGYNPLRNIPGGNKMAGTDVTTYYDFR